MPFTNDQQALFEAYYEKAAQAQEGSKIVQLTYLMIKLMLQAGVAVKKFVHVKAAAVHDKNRGGSPLVPATIFKKGSKIVGVGFSPPLCDHMKAVAFQVIIRPTRA